jgi:hypothetical protein
VTTTSRHFTTSKHTMTSHAANYYGTPGPSSTTCFPRPHILTNHALHLAFSVIVHGISG